MKSKLSVFIFSILLSNFVKAETNIYDLLRYSAQRYPSEMASSFSRAGYQCLLERFIEARMSYNPNGYESKTQFKDEINKFINDVFLPILWDKNLFELYKNNTYLIQKSFNNMVQFYEWNQDSLKKFISLLKTEDTLFMRMPEDSILMIPMYIAFTLYLKDDRTIIKEAEEGSYMWPFCRKKDSK